MEQSIVKCRIFRIEISIDEVNGQKTPDISIYYYVELYCSDNREIEDSTTYLEDDLYNNWSLSPEKAVNRLLEDYKSSIEK